VFAPDEAANGSRITKGEPAKKSPCGGPGCGGGPIGSVTIGPGATQYFGWQINDARGVAGPIPNAQNQVDGWSLIQSSKLRLPNGTTTTGNLTWTATPVAGTQFNMALQTLLFPTTVGNDIQGDMINFHPEPTAPPNA